MTASAGRILTTHVGSLPRPQALADLILAKERGEAVEAAAFEAATAQAVQDVVASQVDSGVDIVSDGEMSKPSYTQYIRHRVNGIAMDMRAGEKGRHIMIGRDRIAHPDFAETMVTFGTVPFPGCVGPLRYADRAPLDRDIAHLRAAAGKAAAAGAFMTAPSPAILTRFVINLHYPDEDAYLEALALVIRTEYEAITGAGFILQIDAPDLASAWNNQHRDKTEAEFRALIARNIEVLNHATAGIAPDRMRLHVCWGNYEGPHSHDIPLARILDIVLTARPLGLSIEAANPRHAHEWEDLATARIPDDKVLIPGVIDSTTNFVEHPRLVAQRIRHFTDIVGRERVIAGVDCGFVTFVTSGRPRVAPSVVWAKLKSLAEGAAIVSRELWR